MKKTVTDVLEAFSYSIDGGRLSSFIKELQEVLEYNQKVYSPVYVELVSSYDYNESLTLLIMGDRLETDKEEMEREIRETLKKEEEYQQYLQLKNKFEKDK